MSAIHAMQKRTLVDVVNAKLKRRHRKGKPVFTDKAGNLITTGLSEKLAFEVNILRSNIPLKTVPR